MVADAGPREHLVELATPLPLGAVDDLSRQVYFVDARVTGFDLVVRDDAVRGLRLRTDRPVPTAELARKIGLLVASDAVRLPHPPPDVAWSSRRTGTDGVRPALRDLADSGVVTVDDAGGAMFAEPALTLIDRLDELLRDLARVEFGATGHRYPVVVPVDTLVRSGYLTSFPQHVVFTSHLPTDLDTHRALIDDLATGGDPGRATRERAGDVTHCLPPTMCYHTFGHLQGRRLPSATTVVTARGPSFRHEGRYTSGLERLSDFTIREVVFIGDPDYARTARDRFLAAAMSLLDDLALAGRCEVSHDPFLGERAAEQVLSQRMLRLKYEARLPVAPDRDIAVASFNVHGDHFGRAFGISLPDGSVAHSACAGFGLERLAYTVFCQHGTDPTGWPPALRPHPPSEKRSSP